MADCRLTEVEKALLDYYYRNFKLVNDDKKLYDLLYTVFCKAKSITDEIDVEEWPPMCSLENRYESYIMTCEFRPLKKVSVDEKKQLDENCMMYVINDEHFIYIRVKCVGPLRIS